MATPILLEAALVVAVAGAQIQLSRRRQNQVASMPINYLQAKCL